MSSATAVDQQVEEELTDSFGGILGGVCFETLAYGLFLCLFIASTYLTVQRARAASTMGSTSNSRSLLKAPMFIVSLLMVLVISMHWATNMSRLFIAISTSHNPVSFGGDPDLDALSTMVFYLLDPFENSAISKMTLLVTTLTLSDIMVTYRLWVVWGYKKRHAIIPLIILALTVTCHVGVVWSWATLLKPQLGSFADKPDGSRFEEVISTIFSFATEAILTMILSIYCTVSMAWKILSVHKGTVKIRVGVVPVLAVFAESAALYTIWTGLFLLTYVLNSSWTFTTVDTWPAVAGISMLYISFRSGMGWYQLAPTGTDSFTPLTGQNTHEKMRSLDSTVVHITRTNDSMV